MEYPLVRILSILRNYFSWPIRANDFYKYIPGKEIKVEDKQCLTREQRQDFKPKESLGISDLLQLHHFIKDIGREALDELKKVFHKNWVNELFTDKDGEKDIEYKAALVKVGYTEEESKKITDYGYSNIKRAKSWSMDNETYGGIAGGWMNLAIVFNVIRNIFCGNDSDYENKSFSRKIFERLMNLAYAFTSSMRGYHQYSEHVYNRPDDEAAMNRYQADVYGNKIAGNLATVSYFTETKVNPFLLPFIALLGNKSLFDKSSILSTLPNLSWWRARMSAHINNGFLTDLLLFVVHKPLSFLGFKFSRNIIEEISKKGNIEFKYFIDRHYGNIRIKDKRTFFNFMKELGSGVVKSISRNGNEQLDSAKKVGETIAPVLGIGALAATAGGIPLKLAFKALGKESKSLDVFASFSMLFQQIIYFFKMTVPAICVAKDAKEKLTQGIKEKKLSDKKLNDLTLIHNKFKNLSILGLSVIGTSVLNTFFKLFNFNNPFLNKLKPVLEWFAGDLVSKFFSDRRHDLGYQFRVENPELFEEMKDEENIGESISSNGHKTNEGIVIRAIKNPETSDVTE